MNVNAIGDGSANSTSQLESTVVRDSNVFLQLLGSTNIDELADSWDEYDRKLKKLDDERQRRRRKALESSELEFHEMYHVLFHSNHWRPLIAQENKFAADLRERMRFGHALLGRLQAMQRIEFKEFVTKEYQEFLTKKNNQFRKQESTDYFPEDDVDFLADESDLFMPPSRHESSYTVHLGGQLKKVMNLRLISAEPFDLLKRDPKLLSYDPVRLQTCMNLYSNTLQGLVLIIDQWDVESGLWNDLVKLCSLWPELHFELFEEQVSKARAVKQQWESGNVLTTKHSGFREVHVLFHVLLAGNQKDLLDSDDINGRHPAILALRTVMRQVWHYDLSVITLPLFLFRQYLPFMTLAWCQKRAELVLKCVKGFMIEMSSLSDEPAKTVQFLVPDNVPEVIFAEMSEMITTIFRSPNPLMKLSD